MAWKAWEGRYRLAPSLAMMGGACPFTVHVHRGHGGGSETRPAPPARRPGWIADALIVRPVSFLVGHPWFADERWVIDSVHRGVRNMIFKVANGHVLLCMPWQCLLSMEGN